MEREPTSEEIPPTITSIDRIDEGFQKSEVGDGLSPVSSQYSSCGESEFERYCSANSVMGTPSLCSSIGYYHDFGDSDSGSVKSPERFSLSSQRFTRRLEERPGSLLSGRNHTFGNSVDDTFYGSKDDEKGLNPDVIFGAKMEDGGHVDCTSSAEIASFEGAMAVLKSEAEIKEVKVLSKEAGKKEDLAVLLKNVENVLLQGAVAARSAAETLFDSNHADEMDDERCKEQDETSSRYEHSDGEDSMFNYGSDLESQPNAYYVRNMAFVGDKDATAGNSLIMNESVAFGARDWDDFELDGVENPLVWQMPDNFWEQQQPTEKNANKLLHFSSVIPTCGVNFQQHEQERNEMDLIAKGDHLLGIGKPSERPPCRSTGNIHSLRVNETVVLENTEDSSDAFQNILCNDEFLEGCSVDNIFEKPNPFIYVPPEMGSMKGDKEGDSTVMQQDLKPPAGFKACEAFVPSADAHRELQLDILEGDNGESSVGYGRNLASSWVEQDKGKIYNGKNVCEDKATNTKSNALEMKALYDDFVHEMEEILLDSCDSHAGKLKERNATFLSEQLSPLRDGGSTASTSGLDNGSPLINHPFVVDGIELVGAKQKKGDVSLSERLVGVKEYTVYVIRVWSGKDCWEVERRYRDFYSLYRQLKALFAAQGWILPPPWASVERESRKFFGNCSPDVVAERSTLIQESLCSILNSSYFSSPPNVVIWFLSPPETLFHSPKSNTEVQKSVVGTDTETLSSLGKTISLIVEIRPPKSLKLLLETQHYTCAGCYKFFDNGKTRMLEIVQTFGWGKPRYCEYTGQLFCSSCHSNETAVLPARVLHHWDFNPYPVSQLAKSYLDSIIDQPMLCVSAANPFLISKVPTLLHIVGVRRKIGAMLPHIRCSFRRSVYGRLGYRKYLLETKDFFALRDLIDLSKGAFAVLPPILDAVSKKIQEHITELCLECCDNGLPCGARQACDNPSSLIFPFQEEDGEIERCKSCNSVFHKHCFNVLADCPCSAAFNPVDETKSGLGIADDNPDKSSPSLLAKQPLLRSSSSFLSSLFSGAKHEKKNDNVILMGFLPSTSL